LTGWQHASRPIISTVRDSAPAAPTFHLGYPRPNGRRDEMMTGGGVLHPHWEELVEALAALPGEEMARRWERGQRLIADHGISYNVPGEGGERPLQLDPMPLVVHGAEWEALEEGLVQRARLFNALLADIYGERRLIAEGLLPPALVLGHPRFLRPCVGLVPPGGSFLTVFASDLARLGDGRWIVLGDRTEAPAGAGFAVENRLIVSRILSEFFRTSGVRLLTPHFDGLRETLLGLSARRFETPRFVLLTPGPEAETYFEHAYLARLLGCTLVESEDLTVRDDRVFLKTLDGLQPVDVIFRQTAGSRCDPLDLDSRSTQGVAGLVRAVKAGSVAVANPLGSGVAESPALSAYLPVLCERLLGEPLALPSVATFWCGDPAARRYVLANLGRLIVKSTFDFRAPPRIGERLSERQRQELATRIEAAPHAFTAQEPVAPSTAPVWLGGRLVPQPVVFRAFLAAREGSYRAMPGALARTSDAPELPTLALQDAEGGSKDTWILSDTDSPVQDHPAAETGPVRLVRGGRDLPSRVADNMFWFGRYMERCEDLTRLLRTVYGRAEDGAAAAQTAVASPLSALMTQLGLPPAARAAGLVLADAATAIGRQQFDPAFATGLAANVDRLQRVAGRVRDRLSLDTWRNIQALRADLRRLPPSLSGDFGEVQAGLNRLILTLEASSGLVMENMTRGLGWRFLDIGRRMERATHVVDLLSGLTDVRSGDMASVLDLLLTVLDSGMTYRSRYFPTPQLTAVLDLLLCDDTNPRSVAYQFGLLGEHVGHLVAIRDATRIRPEQRLMVFLESTVRTADIDVLAMAEEDGRYHHLGKLLNVLGGRLWELSETLTREYFTHANRATAQAREIAL
jgi:uncharacterized circularly permuted ATP-grasp superfamily protein/uncharacterized alpha-E superfamily protein